MIGVALFPLAYVGPGAGFAFLGSFLILFVALILAFLSVLSFPMRFAVSALVRRKKRTKGKARRVIVLGLDGLDPALTRDMISRGELPHFKALAEQGLFTELRTTCPPISPVAWSSFATGVNPGKHNIFDFLNRDLSTGVPELSSTRIHTIKKGRFGRPSSEISLLRKSTPFWKILGDHGVFSTILRVPITFPPEKFYGLSLSAMCTPDLRGTQGSFILYDSSLESEGNAPGEEDVESSEGSSIHVTVENGRIRTYLPGPQVESRILKIPMTIQLAPTGDKATLKVSGQTVALKTNVYSDWVKVSFRARLQKASGICRFVLLSTQPRFRLYVTPINIDPEQPVMPVSHPSYYATYLAKLHGPFATLGLAEDTWALNHGVITDAMFVRQLYDIHDERRRMFLDALDRTREGVCCCVFDLPDRAQHMFFRYLDEKHPARREGLDPELGSPIHEAYRQSDALLGEVLEKASKDDVLFVLSDHGFASFRRTVNLNRWLQDEGLLVMKDGAENAAYLMGIDWSKTQAYAFGLAGIYLNLKGREANGIVDENEKLQIKEMIIEKLTALNDPAEETPAIRAVFDAEKVYRGPYSHHGPDLIVGYHRGYRASWETAKGEVTGTVFSDNTKAWSGDHCIDPNQVPGVLFCNRKAFLNGSKPHIADMAPTFLDLFGIEPPAHMDGRPLQVDMTS